MLVYKNNEKAFGPKKFSFNSFVSLIEQDFSRKVVLLREEEFTTKNIDIIHNDKVYGIVVITPENPDKLLSQEWLDTYEYLGQKSPSYPVYFVKSNSELESIVNQLEQEKRRRNIKMIANDALNKMQTQTRVTDFIGELKRDFGSNFQYMRNSTILVSGMDTLFVNTEKTDNFIHNGAGLVAQLSIARFFSHFIKQFKEPTQNLIYYFCGTKFDNYASFNNFLGSNENTHFTSGARQIAIFDTIIPSDTFDIDVYNIDEKRMGSNNFLNEFVKRAEDMGFGVNLNHHSDLIFNTTVLPVFKINDSHQDIFETWDNKLFEKKIVFLQNFFLNQVYSISADSISEEVNKEINQDSFSMRLKDFLYSVPRSPLDMQKGSDFINDMERLIGLYTEKYIRTNYRIENYGFHRSSVMPITIAVAKHGFTDLLTFLGGVMWIIMLQLILPKLSFKERELITSSKKNKNE